MVPQPAHPLRETAFADPLSPFRRLTQVSTAEVDAFGNQVWKTINEVNLIENIQPTRARATLVRHKGADHSVTRVRLRRFRVGTVNCSALSESRAVTFSRPSLCARTIARAGPSSP
jgi:hypothetical protein